MSRENPRELIKRLARAIVQKHVSERDRLLVETVFARNPTQARLDQYLARCGADAMGGYKALMLSYLVKDHPELVFSGSSKVRMENVIRDYRFANIRVLSHFSKIGKALNREGIPMLLLKGVVLKALRPEMARPMGDVDFFVPKERLRDAVHICEQLGYHDAKTGALQAVDIHTEDGQSTVDIHTEVLSCGRASEAFHKNVLSRARKISAFGVEALCPAPEDTLFILLINVLKNMRLATTLSSLYYALVDCRWLLRRTTDIDWNIVRGNAVDTGAQALLLLSIELLNNIVAGILPDVDVSVPPQGYGYCKKILADEDYFHQRVKARHWARQVRMSDGGNGSGAPIFS